MTTKTETNLPTTTETSGVTATTIAATPQSAASPAPGVTRGDSAMRKFQKLAAAGATLAAVMALAACSGSE